MHSSSQNVSVIIPTYNRAKYLNSAVSSVFEQSDLSTLLEVIIIDDGSTDNTEEVVRSLKFEKIRYIKIPHSGLPSVARNKGISLAKGNLIAFQDSDDYWTRDKLRSQVKIFEDPLVILSYGNAEIIDENSKKTGALVIAPNQAHSGKVFNNLIKENFISTLTVMARKDAIMKVGAFNENKALKAVEDYHLWLRLSALGNFTYVNKPLALYRRHGGNISAGSQVRSLQALVKLFRILIYDMPDMKDIINQRLKSLYLDLGRVTNKPRSYIYKLRALRLQK